MLARIVVAQHFPDLDPLRHRKRHGSSLVQKICLDSLVVFASTAALWDIETSVTSVGLGGMLPGGMLHPRPSICPQFGPSPSEYSVPVPCDSICIVVRGAWWYHDIIW